MHALNDQRGSVLVFVTLIMVLLLIIVGMGLDTGHLLKDANITYVQYSPTDGKITTGPSVTLANANGVRVALEAKNPHTGATPATGILSPLFLVPLFELFGYSVNNTE